MCQIADLREKVFYFGSLTIDQWTEIPSLSLGAFIGADVMFQGVKTLALL